jgi:D-glycerate 3-kinase
MSAAVPDPALLAAALELLDAARPNRTMPLVLGVCGAQGSGKSTLAAALQERLALEGRAAAVLSLDDFYLTREERARLAREVHPLFATRGVPGTHDVTLALDTLAALDCGDAAPLPRFDKAHDDRESSACWPIAPRNCEVVLFEGWCVGARPQAERALVEPVNALERDEDPDGIWRRAVNAALGEGYARLFARIDALLLLAAPGFDVVYGWRREQEQALRRRTSTGMDDAALERFVAHYERLTRHILAEMPGRADVTVRLDSERRVDAIDRR